MTSFGCGQAAPALVVALVVIGCGHSETKAKSAQDTTPTSAEPRLAAVLEENCWDCHGTSVGPELSLPMEPRVAFQAAVMVGSGQMPPSSDMNTAMRQGLVREFCQAGAGEDVAQCMDHLAPGPDPVSYIIPPNWLDRVDLLAPLPAGPPSSGEIRLGRALVLTFRMNSHRMMPDLTYQVLRTLIAEQRCSDLHASGSDKSSSGAYKQCLGELSKLDHLRIPPTPSRNGAGE